MSQINVNNIKNRAGTGAPTLGNGVIVTGVVTATTGAFSGNVSIGGTLTYEDVTNIDVVGIITARSDVSIADKIVHTGDTNTAIRFPAADTFTVETAGSERLRIHSDGEVEVKSAGAGQTTLSVEALYTASGNVNIQTWARDGAAVKTAVKYVDSETMMKFGTVTNHNLAFLTNDTERLRVTNGGLVGIGTQIPDGKLHVFSNSAGAVTANSGADDLVIENNGDCGISLLTANGNNATAIFFGCPDQTVGAAIRYNNNSSEMSLGPDDPGAHLRINSGDGVEAMRIISTGQVGIGTILPEGQLTVKGDGNILAKDFKYLYGNTHGIQVKGNESAIDIVGSDAGSHGASLLIRSSTDGFGMYFDPTRDQLVFRYTVPSADNFSIHDGGNTSTNTEVLTIGKTGIATATQLFEGTSRVATAGKAVAMALVFG